jgi:hypothetical protein
MVCHCSGSQRRGSLLLLFALLMGWCDKFVECLAGRGTPTGAGRRLKSEGLHDEKGDLLEKNVGHNPPKATPLSPSSSPSILATDRPTVAPPIRPSQSPTLRPAALLSSLRPSVTKSSQGWNGTANPFGQEPSSASQNNTPSRPSSNAAPMEEPCNHSTPLEATLINVSPSSATATASTSLNAPSVLLVWMVVAAGIALSVSGSLLLLRRRHKFVQRTKLERKTYKRRVSVELNETMGTHGDGDQNDSRLQMT